jgi:hypothetical protein
MVWWWLATIHTHRLADTSGMPPGALRVFTRRQPFGWGRGGFYTGSSQWPSDRFAWRTLSEYGPSVRSVSTSENDPSAATAVVGM